jgi:hypothetical protein
MSGAAPRATPQGSIVERASITPVSIVGDPLTGRKSPRISSRKTGTPGSLPPSSVTPLDRAVLKLE